MSSAVTMHGDVHSTRRGRIGAILALASATLFGGHLTALEPTNSITQYAHTVWTSQNSHLPGSVFALAQTTDGNLWVGTEFGLLQFDGVRFVPWHAPAGGRLPSEYISALTAGPDGSLWIGTRQGLARWHRGTIQNYQTGADSLAPGV